MIERLSSGCTLIGERRPTRFYTCSESPIGPLLLLSDGEALTGLHMATRRHGPQALADDWTEDAHVFEVVREQLDAYFAKESTGFSLPVAPAGTSFQLRVWKQLLRIPYGATWSYGELAGRIGQPTASRAVGAANGRNPISIVIPCHRVIGGDGSLTGYGGGIERKRWLLEHESPTILAAL